MDKIANLKVDTKLAEPLGGSYRSVEDALKELIDNSYDADATLDSGPTKNSTPNTAKQPNKSPLSKA